VPIAIPRVVARGGWEAAPIARRGRYPDVEVGVDNLPLGDWEQSTRLKSTRGLDQVAGASGHPCSAVPDTEHAGARRQQPARYVVP
jgi:hypothetical protein